MKAIKEVEKVAICKSANDVTFGYIMKINRRHANGFGYYMCGCSRPEIFGTFEEVKNYVSHDTFHLRIKPYAKFRNLIK